jgi:hypothetical protein
MMVEASSTRTDQSLCQRHIAESSGSMEGWDIQRRYRLGQIPAETGMDTHCLEYLPH